MGLNEASVQLIKAAAGIIKQHVPGDVRQKPSLPQLDQKIDMLLWVTTVVSL